MKLYYDRKSKDPSYFIQHGKRNGTKTTTKNICRIGKHSELLANGYKDPLAYAKSVVQDYNKKLKEEKIDFEIKIDFNQKLVYTDNIESKSTLLNVGYIFLNQIYNNLKIKDFINSIVKDKKITYSVNDINRFLTFERILDPKSKYATLKDLSNFYEKPEFEYQHILRSMDILSDNYDEYLSHLQKNTKNAVDTDTTICYYDCTNYYFENEYPDIFYDEENGTYIEGLRQYGVSKEHRPSPIVEMGLFIDKNGIPITMDIFPGNTNEQTTVHDLELKMIKNFENKKIIYCGDAGLGSATIRNFNSMGGKAFIVTQSLKKLSDTIKNEIFDDRGYKLLSSDADIKIAQIKENDELYEDKVYKIVTADSLYDLGLTEFYTTKTGKIKTRKAKGTIKQRIIVTYSPKLAKYQKRIREKQVERATQLILKGVDDIRKGPNDIARFIKKDSNEKNNYVLDSEKITNEERYDGFYALATNLMDDDPREIIRINSDRNKIEDCFRVLKTNFDARPVHHRLDNRIKSHFLICYTALLIYRILEKTLKDKGYHFTINQILNTLKNMNICNRDDFFYEACYTSSQVCTALNDVFDLGLDKKYYMPSEITKKLKKIK